MRRLASSVVAAALALTAVAAASGDAAGAGRADLKIAKATVPPQVTAGRTATFRVTVRNSGGAAGASKVRLFLSNDGRHDRNDVSLGTVRVKGIAAGGSQVVKATFTVPAETGPHHVVACADAGHRVNETSERNNCRVTTATMWVWPKAKPYVARTPDPRVVTPHLGSPTVTKAIGPAGGRVTLRTGGENFHLVVPPKALVSTVDLTMRPISSITGLGMSGGLVAGVDIAPHGLTFLRPARLTLVPEQSVDLSRQAGFTYQGDDAELSAYGLEPDGTLVMQLTHLGGAGVGNASAADRSAQQDRVPTDPEAQWEQRFAPLKDRVRQAHATSAARVGSETEQADEHAVLARAGALAAAYVRDVAVPGLRTALAGDTTRTGPAAIRSFLGAARQLELLGVDEDQSPTVKEGWDLVLQIMDKMIPDAQQRCVAEHDPGMALLMLATERQRQLLGVGDQSVTFAAMNKCLHFELDYEFELHGSAWSDDDTSSTAYGFHLRAIGVPVSIDVTDLEHSGTGSGPESYLQYTGTTTSASSYFNSDGDEVPCTGTATPAGTLDGTFRVLGLKLDLNYYRDDPDYRAPFRLDVQIDPGAIGSDSAPRDITHYSASDPHCVVPVGDVTNWFWGLSFFFAHGDETTDEEGTSYDIRGWTPGTTGSEVLATKVYDRDVVGNGAPHELTSLTLRHTPES
jgi:hypothetical protein